MTPQPVTIYDLDLDGTTPKEPKKKGGYGCAVALWAAFGVIALFFGVVGYRTLQYYRDIRSGKVVEYPQFGDRLTAIAGTGGGTTTVDRASVESPKSASYGPDADKAALTIVEFADFECPYSKESADVARRMMQKYGDRVRFEFRDYPLEEIHHDATQAAMAARCANEQGRFWPFHDKLFAYSPSLPLQQLMAMAEESGLDDRQFERCLLDGRYRTAVESDRKAAQQLGLRGTPTYFFNGRRIDGAIPEAEFDTLIQKLLAQ